MEQTYHNVLIIENETTLQSSDLFINDLEGAKKLFATKIKEWNPSVKESEIQYALDEGYYTFNSVVIMYVEPFNIFGKEN